MSRTTSPYLRKGRRQSQGGVGKLLSSAGLAERASVESLEPRQMLFSLAVTADVVDPATGIGTVRAYFGYAVPYLDTNFTPGTAPPTVKTEGFDDDNPGVVGSNQFFTNSGILAVHNITPAGDFRIVPPDITQNARQLRVVPKRTADFFRFDNYIVGQGAPIRQAASAASFTILPDGPNDNTGIDTDRTALDLLIDGTVVQSVTGAALRALFGPGSNPTLGTGTVTVTGGFNGFRLRLTGDYTGNPALQIDDISFTSPAGNFANLPNLYQYGAVVVLSGPVGATAVLRDLQGADMRRTIVTGLLPGSEVPVIDSLPHDGRPDFNDGIGSITLLNSDSRTAISLWGTRITATTTPTTEDDFFEGGFAARIVAELNGLYDEWESNGFGFTSRRVGNTVTVTGLPPGPGSVMVGAPFVRTANDPVGRQPLGVTLPLTTGFNNANQGFFVENGSIGSIYLHGMLFGSSRIDGAIDRMYAGYMLGSLTVAGDLGRLDVGTDAGQWSPDPGFTPTPGQRVDPINKTASQVIVGRTVGEISITGRSLVDVTVVGDLNNPVTRPARNAFNYDEREWIAGTPTTVTALEAVRALLRNTNYVSRTPQDLFRNVDQSVVTGGNTFRNDTIMSAEYVGSSSAGVRIRGELSGRDTFAGEDRSDVFAFASDGSTDIVIEASLATNSPYIRIVDADGRTLSAPQQPFNQRQNSGGSNRFGVTQLRYRPAGPGVYYLVVGDPNANDTATGNTSYTVVITGMATTSLGAYRTGGGSGFTDIASGEGNSINILSGSIGTLRVGVGAGDAGGNDAGIGQAVNTSQDDDDLMTFGGGTITAPGTLYNITTGSDMGGPGFANAGATINIILGGDLGTIITGLSPVSGGGPNEGDLNFLNLRVGGRIAMIDVRGGIGMDQDNVNDPRAPVGPNTVNITTGTSGGRGDIGMIRSGFHVAGDAMNIVTSPGSTVGALLFSQDTYRDANARSGIYRGTRGLPITTGAGSDIRFVDLEAIDTAAGQNTFLPLIGEQPLTIIDDGGSRVTIEVENAPAGIQVGSVRVLRIDGSQGVAIGQLAVDLSGGRTLRIQNQGGGAVGGGVVGIGRIVLTASDAASRIEISGTVEVDVLRIDGGGPSGLDGGGNGAGEGGLDALINSTPGGDIFAADLAFLNTLEIKGDLGRTQLPAWGPHSYGPFLGVAAAPAGDVGGALGFRANRGAGGGGGGASIDDDFNGNIFRPINNDNYVGGQAFLEEIGGPMDGWLAGLVVRTGNVGSIRVDGAVGDVILQGGSLVQLSANGDQLTALGRFDGIVGTIYADDIGQIDVGDGLAASTGPFATAGIFANDDIFQITSQRASGVRIEGIILAANARATDNLGLGADGLDQFTLTNARVFGAYIASGNIDGFWDGFNYGDDNIATGTVQTINLTATDLTRSEISGRNVGDVTITGFFDASTLTATNNVGRLTATGFRNSTLDGDRLELRESLIRVGENLNQITTTGDISDVLIDVSGSILQGVTGRSMIRTVLNVANELQSLSLTGDLRASELVLGAVPTVTVGGSMQSSELTASGAITSLTAARIANSGIAVTGPGGSIGTITAPGGIGGSISATGPIGTVTTQGDLTASITTTGPLGNVASLIAGRDLAITADISGNVATMTAGRHIGSSARGGVILVRGDLTSASAPSGTLYADLRAGGTLGTVVLGGVSGTPTNNQIGQGSIIAFQRINSVTVAGDFNGSIISYSGGLGSVAITNGSLLPGNTVAAFDGSIGSFTITNGSLFGDVHADVDVTSLRVVAGADGVFGDVGVNPLLSSQASYDARRNQLPPGVGVATAVQGPRISAGRDLVAVVVTNGSVFESSFQAGRSIKSIAITGSVSNDNLTTGRGSLFAAGDSIDSITISGSVSDAAFVGGLVSLGADGVLGGVSSDRVKSGTITKVSVGGQTANTTFSAGIDPGADGIYNTGDDRSALGLSTITTLSLSGAVVNSSAYGDRLSSSVAGDGRLARRGDLPTLNTELDSGSGAPGASFSGTRTFAYSGAQVTITVAGPGQAFFDTGTGRLSVRNGTSATNVTVGSSTGTINNFDIVTNDDGSLGAVTVNAALTGDSDLLVDGTVGAVTLGDFSGSGSIMLGGDSGAITLAAMRGGTLDARHVPSLRINGAFAGTTRPVIRVLSGGTFTFAGGASGVVSADRDLAGVSITGAASGATIRAGWTLATLTAGSVNRTFVSAGDGITSVNVTGDVFDSAFMAGFDLGSDGVFGGAGAAADTLSTGTIGSIAVGGSFRESDAAAGYDRGIDGYFGTADDRIAPGRSSVGTVTVGVAQVGSTRNSEAYRIASSGSITTVTIGGQIVQPGQPIGSPNFAVERPLLQPAPVQVADVQVSTDGRVSTAKVIFNQPVDASTLDTALLVSEVRGAGDVEISLISGIDYTLTYDAPSNTASIRFSQTVTDRNLPQVPGRPGPGVYRFRLAQNTLGAKLANQKIDGNSDGFTRANDSFSSDAQVGDAGDKLTAGVATTTTGYRVDFYAPSNLDIVLDDNRASDGLPEVNRTFTIRGSIGDHADNDTNNFSFAGDVDLYAITLQAGQIIHLGALQGSALRAGLTLLDASGVAQSSFASGANTVGLPVPTGTSTDLTFANSFLIKRTGTYYIAVGQAASVGTTATIPNPPIPPGGVGDYNFTLRIFDDGDSGFSSTTNAGDGTAIVDAPAPIAFAGVDGVFGTGDDQPTIVVGDFSFTLGRGADNTPNTADDLVSGSNGAGITTTRTGTGRLTTTVDSSIGPGGHVGIPRDVAPDVDVYHLNNRQPIAPGTKVRMTLRLTDLGGDLGSADPATRTDLRGAVQFGLFDTSGSVFVEDGTLVFSPSDFKATGGTPNTTIADNGATKYGYDAKGDFFIEFVMPDRVGAAGQPGTFAAYIQGVNNTDYQLEIIADGTGAPIRRTQNVLIETSGGQVDWLQAGGEITTVSPLDVRPLGLSGTATNGQPVQTYVVNNLLASLTSLFQGYDIRFSTSPAAFEGQEFSTIFLTGSNDPVAPLFDPFTASNFGFLSNQFVSTQPYGFSQHSDPFNADLTDEGVVFIPSFALLGIQGGQQDFDLFTQDLTAAVSRRVGELLGLRITTNNGVGAAAFDPFAADGVGIVPGPGRAYTLSGAARDLSSPFDTVTRTDFGLGQQNARSLLDKILLRI